MQSDVIEPPKMLYKGSSIVFNLHLTFSLCKQRAELTTAAYLDTICFASAYESDGNVVEENPPFCSLFSADRRKMSMCTRNHHNGANSVNSERGNWDKEKQKPHGWNSIYGLSSSSLRSSLCFQAHTALFLEGTHPQKENSAPQVLLAGDKVSLDRLHRQSSHQHRAELTAVFVCSCTERRGNIEGNTRRELNTNFKK